MRPVLLLFASFVLPISACTADSTSTEDAPIANVAVSEGGDAAQAGVPITVYKSPTCGCCGLWVEHLEANDFDVQVVEMENVNSVKEYYGIPSGLTACHTAIVDGYVIEGHVPADDIYRLLDEKPEAIGISVPGMPVGSPGMEVEGRPADEYDVLLVTEDGSSVFASH